MSRWTYWITILFACALATGLFVVLPSKAAEWVVTGVFWRNAVEVGIRLLFFILYVVGISFLPDIRRLFRYHGAEHKTVNAYEAGEALTVENVRRYDTLHARCGTSFIVLLIVLAMLAHLALGWPSFYWRVLSRLALLPVVAGVSYEIIRLAGRKKHARWLAPVVMPGVWLQRITTRQPSDDMVEVAIKAMETALADDRRAAEQKSAAQTA